MSVSWRWTGSLDVLCVNVALFSQFAQDMTFRDSDLGIIY